MLIDGTILGEAMGRLRGERSQRFACRRAGVPAGTWSNWENGQRQPRKSQIEKILRGLDCNIDDLEMEIWKVQTDRFRGRELEPLVAIDREFRRRIEDLWQLDFSELTPAVERAMSRMRSRIDAMWEMWTLQFEPLIGDFETLSRTLSAEDARRAGRPGNADTKA